MSDIDPIQFGKLIQSVESLTAELQEVSEKVQTLTRQMDGGKGVVIGLLIAAGGIGAAASELIKHVIRS